MRRRGIGPRFRNSCTHSGLRGGAEVAGVNTGGSGQEDCDEKNVMISVMKRPS